MPPVDDPYRPYYHFTPPAQWMNDPNGLVYFEGEYHLFYQYHPASISWGPMHWGHAVSRDLVSWQHLPIALYPDENGAIFSGCALIDWHNTAGFGEQAMLAIFTHDRENMPQRQSLAYSLDRGRTWVKYPGNPLLLPPAGVHDFRDPKVFWYAEGQAGHWVMSLAAGDAIRFYTSADLIHWQPSGIFGEQHGCHSGVWETPDLFQLPVDGGPQTRWVLLVGVGDGGMGTKTGVQYFSGHFDGETFHSEDPPGSVLWMDAGDDFYAAQSWSDEPSGRRVLIGWQSNWQYANRLPTSPWRGMFSLPRELSLRRTVDGMRLFQQPVGEAACLRGALRHWQDLQLSPGVNPLAGLSLEAGEILVEYQSHSPGAVFGLRLRVGEGEQTTVAYDAQKQVLFVDRSQSGQSDFHPGFARRHAESMPPVDGLVRMHIFLDRSCLEVFGNHGQVAISDLIFPDRHSCGLELFCLAGEVRLNQLDIYTLLTAPQENSAG